MQYLLRLRSFLAGALALVFAARFLFFADFIPVQSVSANPFFQQKDNDKKKKKDDDKKKDDPKRKSQVDQYLKQLNARFNAWDQNNDNVLDKGELARAFRGPKAQPFDILVQQATPPPPAPFTLPPTTEKLPLQHKIKPISVALACLPSPGLPVNLVVAEILAQVKPIKTATPPPPTPKQQLDPRVLLLSLPDYQFLLALNKKGSDDKINKQEFDSWAKQYARLIDDFEDAQFELKQARGHLQSAKTPQAQASAQKEVARYEIELARANSQLSTIPPAIHKALSVNH